MNRVQLLRLAERLAVPLRKLGLGGLVERVRVWTLERMGRFSLPVEGVVIQGRTSTHISYVRELAEEAREGYMAELFHEAVRPGMTVVDIGAHLGYFTLQAARRVGPQGRVFAFEPNPDTLPFLRANVDANGVADRVTIVDRALAARTGTATLFVAPSGDTTSLHPGEPDVTERTVELVAADDVLAGAVPDVVKLDVEGGEVEVLQGMGSTLSRVGPGFVLFAECNPEALRRAGHSADELMAALRAAGLEPQVVEEDARALAPVRPLAAGERYVNLLCRRSSESAAAAT